MFTHVYGIMTIKQMISNTHTKIISGWLASQTKENIKVK